MKVASRIQGTHIHHVSPADDISIHPVCFMYIPDRICQACGCLAFTARLTGQKGTMFGRWLNTPATIYARTLTWV